ncbi:MAG: type III-B CRISPR module RAMP protein Cmr4 [Cyanobacteria bacterium P01_A01_bin.40]
MYKKAFGIIETLAPLHVGASAGEETGNLNLIFRDQFTKTGIIPGSSIRGRFRADMRSKPGINEADWYGRDSDAEKGTSEAEVKFEYASLVWLPVFCPGQPIVWVTCPRLLKRYRRIDKSITAEIPQPYTASKAINVRDVGNNRKILFFNLGFLEIEHLADLSQDWLPANTEVEAKQLVVVGDNDISTIHDMALYRQSRVALKDEQKIAKEGAFFSVEALPEGSVLVFPVGMKKEGWQPLGDSNSEELYFGGLESIGFGRCQVTITKLDEETE